MGDKKIVQLILKKGRNDVGIRQDSIIYDL